MGIFRAKGRRTQKKLFRAKGSKGRTNVFPNKKRKLSVRALAVTLKKMAKTIETKSGTRTITDGQEYLHNKSCTV